MKRKWLLLEKCIDNGKNYKETCVKYGVKYSNLYSWVSKYQDKILKSLDYSQEDKYKILYELSIQENKMLKAELEILKKRRDIRFSRKKRIIHAKYLTVDALKNKYSVKYLCEVLELNRSSYYEYLNRNNEINKEEIELINLIKTIDQEVKSTYGRKRMTIEVAKRCGIKYNEKKIRRIMIEEDIVCLIRAKR